MVFGKLFARLLGRGRGEQKRPQTGLSPNVTIEVSGSGNSGAWMTGAEYAAYLDKHRRDEAARAWRKNPDPYRPIRELSTEPVCPCCGESLGRRKPPSRRSKFACRSCGSIVCADPWHRIFASCYLNARQGLIARYLGILDKAVSTAGKSEDFWWAAQQKEWLRGKTNLTDAEAGDALWTLMNYNVLSMEEILPPEEKQSLPYHAEELQRLMREYREEERALAEEIREAKIGKGEAVDGRIELLCPNCGNAQGRVAKPSRRSRRTCKACGETVVVDPKQSLFKGPFLTERQAYLADTLAQLDHWVFTSGSMSDFRRVKKALGKLGDLGDRDVADVLRALIVENVESAKRKADKQHEECIRLFANEPGYECACFLEVADIKEFLAGFDEELKQLFPS